MAVKLAFCRRRTDFSRRTFILYQKLTENYKHYLRESGTVVNVKLVIGYWILDTGYWIIAHFPCAFVSFVFFVAKTIPRDPE